MILLGICIVAKCRCHHNYIGILCHARWSAFDLEDALRTLEATVDSGGLRAALLSRQSGRTYRGPDVAASKRDPAEACSLSDLYRL
jgi:hypothetical protein